MKTRKQMNQIKLFKFFAVMNLMLSPIAINAHAQADQAGNGGDIQEKRFAQIADDIKGWINKGGAADLILPAGVDRENYVSKMLK